MGDPRVFFAAERTLLAWMRSGLTVIGLGFVVARFGLVLNLVAMSNPAAAVGRHPHWPSNALGIVLVVFGAASILGALYNHHAYVRTLPPEDLPELPFPRLASLLSLSIAITGFLLAAYLAAT